MQCFKAPENLLKQSVLTNVLRLKIQSVTQLRILKLMRLVVLQANVIEKFKYQARGMQ